MSLPERDGDGYELDDVKWVHIMKARDLSRAKGEGLNSPPPVGPSGLQHMVHN